MIIFYLGLFLCGNKRRPLMSGMSDSPDITLLFLITVSSAPRDDAVNIMALSDVCVNPTHTDTQTGNESLCLLCLCAFSLCMKYVYKKEEITYHFIRFLHNLTDIICQFFMLSNTVLL